MPDVTALVSVLVGSTIGTIIGRRRFVRNYMPASAEQWSALAVADRLRIRWAVARGDAVADIRLAAPAAAFAHARRVLLVGAATWKCSRCSA